MTLYQTLRFCSLVATVAALAGCQSCNRPEAMMLPAEIQLRLLNEVPACQVSNSAIMGSGLPLSESLVLTSRHILLRPRLTIDGGPVRFRVSLQGKDDDSYIDDWAIIALDAPIGGPYLSMLLCKAPMEGGQRLYIVGFRVPDDAITIGAIETEKTAVACKVVPKPFFWDEQTQELIFARSSHATTYFGLSGAPVVRFNEHDQIEFVGIYQGTTKRSCFGFTDSWHVIRRFRELPQNIATPSFSP